MMTLVEYQKLEELNDVQLGRLLGISGAHVAYLKTRKRRASPELAIKIERVSNGRVSRSELRPDLWSLE